MVALAGVIAAASAQASTATPIALPSIPLPGDTLARYASREVRASPSQAGGRGIGSWEPVKGPTPSTVGRSQPKGEHMADAALFIGWGQVVRGREKRAVEVFNESVAYWG